MALRTQPSMAIKFVHIALLLWVSQRSSAATSCQNDPDCSLGCMCDENLTCLNRCDQCYISPKDGGWGGCSDDCKGKHEPAANTAMSRCLRGVKAVCVNGACTEPKQCTTVADCVDGKNTFCQVPYGGDRLVCTYPTSAGITAGAARRDSYALT
jgi:hypothetical protein